jgi:hypothetical protein
MSHRGACFVHQSFLIQEVAKSSVFMHISSYANNPNLVVKKSCVSKKIENIIDFWKVYK